MLRLRVFCIATACNYLHYLIIFCCCIVAFGVCFPISVSGTNLNQHISLKFKKTTIIEGFLPFARPTNTKSMQSILIILDFGL